MKIAPFKRWFVDFEFPDENGKPYKSSGGNMVASELGEIPKGWEVGKTGNFGKIVCGKTPPKHIKEYYYGKIPFIKIPDMHNTVFVNRTQDSLTAKGSKSQLNKLIPAHSINVSCIATIGLVTINKIAAHTNQQINSIIPKSESYTEYLFLTLRRMKDYLLSLGSGGTATFNINTTIFSNVEIMKPKNNVLNDFHKISMPLFNKISNGLDEIETLTKIRDTLLPKLMSGRIRVPAYIK